MTYSKGPLQDLHVADLSHVVSTDIPIWPQDPAVQVKECASFGIEGYALNEWVLGEHVGTHINAPSAFLKSGPTIDRYEGDSLISPAVCIDVHDRVSHNANYLLTMADLKDWEYTFGSIEDGSVVLLNTGWSAYWDDPSRYIYVSRDGDMTFPGFSEEATKFLISDRSIRGVGIDSPGVDGGSNLDYSINKLVLSEKRIVLENLTNMSVLPPVGVSLSIGIIKLKGGHGSPASVMAYY